MEQIKPTLTTIVMGIFGFSSEGQEEFSRQKVYDALFSISKEEPFKEIFSEASFTRVTDGYNYSKEIERVLFRLGNGKVVEMKSPDFKTLEISQKAKKSVIDYLTKQYTNSDIEFMESAAKRFRELIQNGHAGI